SSANALEFFQTGATGSATPLRIVSGASTGLGSCAGPSCDQLAVAFSPSTSRLYVGVSNGTGTPHVSVFTQSASGDVAPLQTIQGPTTGLSGRVITGIASGPCTGDIYVMVKGAQFSSASQIYVYDHLAQGDVAPKRTFTDASNAFADAEGIAITVGPPLPPAVPASSPAGATLVALSLAGLGLTVNARRRRRVSD
ncbi:MAG: hypothetical protein JOZ69_18005, partial [Myxococcales bacterium]|nr:hypothetical protein [Myxococcales bacterium]